MKRTIATHDTKKVIETENSPWWIASNSSRRISPSPRYLPRKKNL
jgi:hypothetical protein